MTLPENMKVLHDCDFTHDYLQQYTDEIYFRMKHDLINLHSPSLPGGFSLCNITLAEYAMHINGCYADISMTENEIRSYSMHPVYSPELWLAVKNDKTREIAATGIAELDAETGEGILEWIQVSEAYRGCGLGTYIVTELLCRIAKKAKFATVSGQVQNPSNPEALYRKCGFTGNDIWHILRKKHSSDEMTVFAVMTVPAVLHILQQLGMMTNYEDNQNNFMKTFSTVIFLCVILIAMVVEVGLSFLCVRSARFQSAVVKKIYIPAMSAKSNVKCLKIIRKNT